MDASDWIALVAVLIALAGLAVAIFAAVYARRSADSAQRSADEAARLGDVEEERRAEERQRWHSDHEPVLPGEIEAKYKKQGASDPGALFGEITVPRAYRVRADAVSGPATMQISMDGLTVPDQKIEFMIERWHSGKRAAETEEIVFKFWPPAADVTGANAWTCGCGKPVDELPDGDGHWERRVKVRYAPARMRSF